MSNENRSKLETKVEAVEAKDEGVGSSTGPHLRASVDKAQPVTLTRTVKVRGKSVKQSVTTSKATTVTQLKSEGWKVEK